MKFWRNAALAAAVMWISSAAFALTDPSAPAAQVSALAGLDASEDALYAEHWIRTEGDNHDRPFAIVDKKAARIYVFGPKGQLVGTSSTILGLARGDVPVPGAGQKDPSKLLPFERKTPAGRFASQPGRNLNGEDVVWVDYETGIAIHRVRPGRSQTTRLHSLATDAADDKRMSAGCVVVPVDFFTSIVMPTLGHVRGIVYVLPEDTPVQAMFQAPTTTAAAPAGGHGDDAALPSRLAVSAK